jgi:hypothetical protein
LLRASVTFVSFVVQLFPRFVACADSQTRFTTKGTKVTERSSSRASVTSVSFVVQLFQRFLRRAAPIAPFPSDSRPAYHSAVRRPAWFRLLTALWGLWFTTALTEPAGFLACPMHSGGGMHEVAAVAPSPTAESHAHHVGMVMDQSPDAAASVSQAMTHDAPTPDGHPCCTCLGQCCTMSPADMPQSPVIPSAATPLQTAAQPIGYQSRLRTRIAYAIPYANGPPSTVA